MENQKNAPKVVLDQSLQLSRSSLQAMDHFWKSNINWQRKIRKLREKGEWNPNLGVGSLALID